MSEEKEKKDAPKAAAKPSAEQKPQKVIYLGPPMIEGAFQISYGAVFSNGLPAEVEERKKSDAEFAKLFKAVEDAPKAMRELTQKNSALALAKRKVSKDYLERKSKKRGK